MHMLYFNVSSKLFYSTPDNAICMYIEFDTFVFVCVCVRNIFINNSKWLKQAQNGNLNCNCEHITLLRGWNVWI